MYITCLLLYVTVIMTEMNICDRGDYLSGFVLAWTIYGFMGRRRHGRISHILTSRLSYMTPRLCGLGSPMAPGKGIYEPAISFRENRSSVSTLRCALNPNAMQSFQVSAKSDP